MKTIRNLTLGLLLAIIAATHQSALAASTSELLQQGLYAEEVEGNVDSAIKIYSQIIKNTSAPSNHVAQALYRQGMCYMKLKNETAARAALEKLVTEYPNQTEIVEKAKPVLDDLTDFDPASLMPPGTLVYVELGTPGRQIETILSTLKGTPLENPFAAMAGQQTGNNSRGDFLGALLNPSMLTEFKKIRSSAIGITGIANNNPPMVSVLYPGKSDALRGLILASLGMGGTPGETIEGMQTVNIKNFGAVAYDERIFIAAQPASQLEWCVKQYKGLNSGPSLATGNKSFARLSKSQRQKNTLTLWANVDEGYSQLLKMFPADQIPGGILSANAFMDFSNIDEFTLTQSIETNGLGSRIEFDFKDGHHCLAYDLIRTPHINKAALEAVPSEAVAVASFSLSQTDSGQNEKIRAKIQNVTGLDVGREVFSNIQQITVFAVPTQVSSPGSATNALLPDSFGLAITSRNPDQTRQVLATLLGTLSGTQPDPGAGRFKVNKSGQPDMYCYVEQVSGVTLVSLNRRVIDASAASIRNHKSICVAGPLSDAVKKLTPDASKLILVNAAGALRLFGPQMQPHDLTAQQSAELQTSMDQLAHATESTTLELRTDEQLNNFSFDSIVDGIPRLNEVLGPATQCARIFKEAKAESEAKNLRQSTPAMIVPATKPPIIDGNEDEAWRAVPRNKLENVIKSFGSGEKVMPITSPDDLSADFRAMWDENNLYLLVDVTDDKLVNDTSPDQAVKLPSGSDAIPWWWDDCIEVYIDADNAKRGEYGPNDAHYHFDWDAKNPTMGVNNDHGNIHGKTNGVEFATITTAKGYRTEIKFPWKTLATKPSVGSTIGLDVHVNDDDDGGTRDKKITWRDRSDQAYHDTRRFGNAELGGLLGWWKFDEMEGQVAKDSSGLNHNGALVGHAKWAKGKKGGAIDLDGVGSFVRIADKSAFNLRGNVTLACWANIRTVPAEWTALITKGDSTWRLSTLHQEKQFHFGLSDPTRNSEQPRADGKTTVGENSWHHVAAVYDGSTMRLYVDGKLDSSKEWSGGIGWNDADVLIGENVERPNRCFDGLIDDVRIYNYAVSEDQIKALAGGQ